MSVVIEGAGPPEVPDWLLERVRYWRDRLLLTTWRLRISLAHVIDNDPDIAALTQQHPDLNTCEITYRADVAPDAEGENRTIHELLHVAHARVDTYVERAMIPQLPHDAQQLAREVYHQLVESLIAQMTTVVEGLVADTEAPQGQ